MIELVDATIERGGFCLHGLSMKIESGQFAVLRGANGAGKTTIIETLCGAQSLSAGQVILRGQPANSFSMAQRQIGWVPQDSVLFDHLTVGQQIGLPLKIRRWPSSEIQQRVTELATALNIEDLLDRYPKNLSGGEARRVALARAASFSPDIMCLDESLVSLDSDTRQFTADFLKQLQQHQHATILLVSHDSHDAQRLADCVWELTDGQLRLRD